ncbi:MAG: LptF/LptG family permease [Phycisphaerae bacterium]|nr:LptF/LptG family permease [Phycisphaerae bacterium]
MPGILFRHIFLELLKVLTVTTAVLVTVIAFGAAIKPLSENLLEAGDLLRYIVYATIPMMQYALPFSAAYAGTIVYHRLASDNEISAMATSGIPYRRILRPALAMGAVLTLVMLVLLDRGVPTFWQALKRIAPNDAMRLLAAQVRRGEAWIPPGLNIEIYADDAYVRRHDGLGDDPSTPTQRLVLERVVALEKDEKGNPKAEFTAEVATVDQYRVGDSAYLKVVLSNATIFDRADSRFARAAVVRPDAVVVPSFEQGPKGLTFGELLTARHDLSVFPVIVETRRQTMNALETIDAWSHVASTVASEKPLTLFGTGDAENVTLEVLAGEARERELVGRQNGNQRQVVIRQYETVGGERTLRREITAPAAKFFVTMLDADRGPRLELSADNAVVVDRRVGDRGIRRAVRYSELAIGGLVSPDRGGMATDAVLSEAAGIIVNHGGSGAVGDAAPEGTDAVTPSTAASGKPPDALLRELKVAESRLRSKVRELSDDIVARIVQRISQSVTALLMIVNAAILAVLLRGKPALLVYVIGFLPAIGDILLISGGEQMLRGEVSWLGVAVAFGGNVLIGIACIVNALLLRKH